MECTTIWGVGWTDLTRGFLSITISTVMRMRTAMTMKRGSSHFTPSSPCSACRANSGSFSLLQMNSLSSSHRPSLTLPCSKYRQPVSSPSKKAPFSPYQYSLTLSFPERNWSCFSSFLFSIVRRVPPQSEQNYEAAGCESRWFYPL